MNEPTKIDCEFRIYGLRRSGNHAIINWILRQVDGVSAFYNDTFPEDPYSLTPRYVNYSDDEAPSHLAHSILSFEDRSFRLLRQCEKKLAKYQSRPPNKRIDILIMRDPFNLFASRKKSSLISHLKPDYNNGLSLPQITLEYLDAFVHQRSPVNPEVETLFVNFNQWKSDKAYREFLADQLGLRFSDTGWSIVSRMGGGSSFDGEAPDAKQLNLESRWETYAEDPTFQKLFRDPELIRLARLGFAPLDENLEDWITKSIEPISGCWRPFFGRLSSKALQPIYLFLRSQRLVLEAYRKLLQIKS